MKSWTEAWWIDTISTVLQDPDRIFLTRPLLYLETVPKAVYFKRGSELAFYRVYFTRPSVEWRRDLVAVQFESRAQAVCRHIAGDYAETAAGAPADQRQCAHWP